VDSTDFGNILRFLNLIFLILERGFILSPYKSFQEVMLYQLGLGLSSDNETKDILKDF
jgi:hypothetical protein